jgi:hypothetical protein
LQVQQTAVDSHSDLNPTNSCLAKGTHRIYPGGAAGWDVACQSGDCKQKQRHDEKDNQIMRANTVEQTCHRRSGRSGNYHAGHNSEASQDYTFSQDKSQDILSLGTQRQSETNLA